MVLLRQKEIRETNDCAKFEVIFLCKLKIVIISRRIRRFRKNEEEKKMWTWTLHVSQLSIQHISTAVNI